MPIQDGLVLDVTPVPRVGRVQCNVNGPVDAVTDKMSASVPHGDLSSASMHAPRSKPAAAVHIDIWNAAVGRQVTIRHDGIGYAPDPILTAYSTPRGYCG